MGKWHDFGCTWIYGHKQSGSNITTRGDYIITQYVAYLCELLGLSYCTADSDYESGTSSTNPSRNWTWQQYGNDGAHAYALSNLYYTIDYKNYPDPVIKQSGSTYYIDYGAVDMSYQSGHWDLNPSCIELPCPAGTTNNGTWYNHTAATANSSLGMVNDGDIALDSICPKGWMLSSTGIYSKKSYENLLGNTYGGVDATSRTNASTIVTYPPISLIFAGYYRYEDTKFVNIGYEGSFWESQNRSTTNARRLYAFRTSLAITSIGSTRRGNGNPIRCVSRD